MRDVEAVDRVKEKQGADFFVEVTRLAAECIESRASLKQFVTGKANAGGIEGLIAQFWFSGGDDLNQIWSFHGRLRRARSSTRPERTSSRSLPSRARASWAVRRPYLTPMS